MIFGTVFLGVIILIFYLLITGKANPKCPYCNKPMANNKGKSPFDPYYNRYRCYDCKYSRNN